MARRKKPKVYQPTTKASSNYFPDLTIGIPKKFIYYSSLLYGDDERFEGNRRIGMEAKEYLNNIRDINLTPSSNTDIMNTVNQAIDLLYRAAINEQKKEKAWLRDAFGLLGFDMGTYDETDYLQLIQILNEVEKDTENAKLAIAAEAARWRGIDIDKVLEAKKLQNSHEAAAKRMSKTGNDQEKIKEQHKKGEDIYWKSIDEDGNPIRLDSSHIKTTAQVIGDILKNARKMFTGTGRSLAEQIQPFIFPHILKAIEKCKGDYSKINLDKVQLISEQLLQKILEDIILEELRHTNWHEANIVSKRQGFLTTNNLKAKNGQSSRKQQLTRYIEANSEKIQKWAEELVTTNSYIGGLSNYGAMTPEEAKAISRIKDRELKITAVKQKLARELLKQQSVIDDYNRHSKGDKNGRTGRDLKVGTKSKRALEWIIEHRLNSLSEEDILLASVKSVRQRYYYSEELTQQEAIKKVISGMINSQGAFLPNFNPKSDVVTGYIVSETTYDESGLRELEKGLRAFQKEIENYNKTQESRMKSIFNNRSNSNEDKSKIWASADKKSYAHNAALLADLREEQLKDLERLNSMILEQEENAKQIMTQYNVFTSVKDQSGLLDTFTPNSAKGKDAVGRFRERGIGFSGGSIGKNDNGFSVIDNIVALGKEGHILSDRDAEWLKFALVNSGLGLLGYKNRFSLENYIAMFAAFLMFEDAQLAIADTIAQSANLIDKQLTVQNIHLYVVNGVYVPQSYILMQLYETMSKIKMANGNDFDKRNLSQDVVRAQIYGYNVGSKYPGNTPEDWQREANTAREKTKIKMYFLMNMGQLVNQLADQMGVGAL